MSIETLLAAGEVQRFHQFTMTPRNQTVAEHSWRMGIIALHLYAGEAARLLPAILVHDAPEGRQERDGSAPGTGDIPAPVKRLLPVEAHAVLVGLERDYLQNHRVLGWIDMLTKEEQRRLKVCDYLELMLTCYEQYSTRGNKPLWMVYNVANQYLHDIVSLPMEEFMLMSYQYAMAEAVARACGDGAEADTIAEAAKRWKEDTISGMARTDGE